MLHQIGKNMRKFAGCESGNAMIFTGIAMPILIGVAGFAVDMSQWYLWKRELQFAVDQAAIAGAFARVDTATQSTYSTRASQEFYANLAVASNFSTAPTIGLADYNGGTDNAIQVEASASKALPFSSLFMTSPAQVYAVARATFEGGNTETHNSCIIALNETAGKAAWFHGNPTIDAQCGLASLSTASNSIEVNGSPGDYNFGTVLAAGGIDDHHDNFGNATVVENMTGLSDPYEGLTPPDNATPRSLSCASSSSTYTADVTVTSSVEYDYFRGPNTNNNSPYNYSGGQSDTSSSSTSTGQSFSSVPSNASSSSENWIQLSGNGQNRIWERVTTTSSTTYTNVVEETSGGGAMLPGTYSDFNISCDTVLSSGVYVIDGGDFDINAQNSLTGSGVMFVLKNGADIKINGGANLSLTGMSAAQLTAVGVSQTDAEAMEGMLVFEDANSQGSDNRINGNSGLSLSGVIYLPNSPITLLGTMQGVSRCLSIAADTIEIGGTADLSSLCPAGDTPEPVVSSGGNEIRLVL